ncbi:MAG: hypothetical protein ABL958_02195 [Bdellovibrionia bacterium]
MKLSMIKYLGLGLLAAITMGAAGCDDPPSVVGNWDAECQFTNPASKGTYYWTFAADDGSGQPPEFHHYEVLADGTVEDYLSFYMYNGNTLTVSNPTSQNGDRLFLVLDAGPDKLSLVGGEYKCVLTRTSDAHP